MKNILKMLKVKLSMKFQSFCEKIITDDKTYVQTNNTFIL